jgi:hypothetical protein
LALLLGLAVSPSITAAAESPTTSPNSFFSDICYGASTGTAVSGDYLDLTVTGNMYVPDGLNLTVKRQLTIARGACLDAFSLSTVHVGQNVFVEDGATLALGCAPGAAEGPGPCGNQTMDDTVGGNIIANRPLTMYLTAINVAGDVISNGGGPGSASRYAGVSFPVKSMTIGGDLLLQGWNGPWIGALRNTVRGSMIVDNNVGYRIGDSGTNDSTEIVDNTVRQDLICFNNTPPAQFGDALEDPLNGNGFNKVHGKALGECKAIST